MSAEDLDALGERIEAINDRSQELIRDVQEATLSRTRYVISLLDQSPQQAAVTHLLENDGSGPAV